MLWLSYGYVMVILWYWLEIGTRLGRKTSLQPSLKGRGKGRVRGRVKVGMPE